MIMLFIVSFIAGLIMMFTGFIRGMAVHSNIMNVFDDSKAAKKARKAGLRVHWLVTLVLFAIAMYAGINL